MADVKPTGHPQTRNQTAHGKTAFLLRKCHSISGLVPVGFFLLEHIWTNAHAIYGRESFDGAVAGLQKLPFLIFLEICFIWIPILYHGGYGMYITFTGQPNTTQYPFGRNWLYLLQRITGILAFAFIIYHVATMRLTSPKTVTYDGVLTHLTSPTMFVLYTIGVAATVFHFSNGLWNLTIKWGIAVGPKTQRVSLVACSMLGLLLLAISLVSLYSFE